MNSRAQRGAAIVVVMLVLLVITVLGMTAVRMGLTSLTIATNSQVGALLFQSADTGLNVFERAVVANLSEAAKPTGLIGPALNNPGTEVIYCVTKANQLRAGVCDAANSADYTSARDVSINQLAVEVPAAADGSPMRSIVLGSDPDRAGIPTYKVVVHSTSVVPVFGAADSDEVTDCLDNVNDDTDTPAEESVTDCLTDDGAVFTTMVQDYDYGYN